MSIYSEQRLKVQNDMEIDYISISQDKQNPTIAVSQNNMTRFYNMNGDKLGYELKRDKKVSCLQWHSKQNTLAVGYQSGNLVLLNYETTSIKENGDNHKAKIILIEFNNEGNRMITSDEKGMVIIWKNLQVLSKYQREKVINHITYCQLEFGDVEKDMKLKNSNLFFMGGQSGIVCLADDNKHCSEVCKVSGSIKSLLFYKQENSVVIITSTLLFVQFRISPNQKTTPDKKVKLSIFGNSDLLQSIWVGQSVLATSSGENIIRLWDIKQDQNYILNNTFNDKIIMIKYYNNTILGGSKDGRIIFWDQNNQEYQMKNSLSLNSIINDIRVSHKNILVKYGNNVGIIQQSRINQSIQSNYKLLQSDNRRVQIYDQHYKLVYIHEHKQTMKSIYCNNEDKIVIQTNDIIEVGQIENGKVKVLNQIQNRVQIMACYNDNMIQTQDSSIQISSLKGVVKQNIQINDNEGIIVDFSQNNNHFVLFTSNNYVRVYDLNRREIKQTNISRRFEDSRGQLGDIKKVSINSDGSKVAVMVHNKDIFYIYDLELDQFNLCEIKNHDKQTEKDKEKEKEEKEEISANLTTNMKTEQEQEEKEQPDQEEKEQIIVCDIVWDQNDRRYLGVLLDKGDQKQEIVLYFYSNEIGIKRQDNIETNEIEGLYSLQCPYIYKMVKNQNEYQLKTQILNDYLNVDEQQLMNNEVIQCIMNFSFYLCVNNIEEAYKSVKSIQDPTLWENMAQMCVKSKRLDVAEICIGKMKFGRGAKAIRESKQHKEQEAQMAMVAIQLNMKQEAEKLYLKCKRYDLLNKMYQSDNQYQKSIQISQQHDRINLNNSYFQMAKYHEQCQSVNEAIYYYEQSKTHKQQVPQMLIKMDQFDKLQEYAKEKNESEIYQYCGQYLESLSQFAQAIQYYTLAEDYESIVNIYIFNNDIENAIKVANQTNDQKANLQLGKYYESKTDLQEALHFYSKSQFYSRAVRIAKQLNNDSEVMSLSNQAPKQIQEQSAQYFITKGHNEKAVILLIKSKNYQKAMSIAVKNKLFDYVKRISNEIELNQNTSNIDSNNMGQMAQQFIQNQQYDKAVQLLIASKQYEKGLEICVQHDVMITEELSTKILNKENSNYQEQLQMIADLAKKQGNFDLASRKYIELNQKTIAMKCLINLGNMQKVITFGQNARQTDIYILAANFLQGCDWSKNPEIAKFIIQFYSKAKAFSKLSDFYDNCAQLEIDEFKDYQKAQVAMKEAIKHSIKANEDTKVQQLQQKSFFIDKFIQARNSPDEVVQICNQLLENPSINNQNGIKYGDIYCLLLEYHYDQNDYHSCYKTIQSMKAKNITLTMYLDQKVIQHIYQQVGEPYEQQSQQDQYQQQQQNYEQGDYIEDEIQEDF